MMGIAALDPSYAKSICGRNVASVEQAKRSGICKEPLLSLLQVRCLTLTVGSKHVHLVTLTSSTVTCHLLLVAHHCGLKPMSRINLPYFAKSLLIVDAKNSGGSVTMISPAETSFSFTSGSSIARLIS